MIKIVEVRTFIMQDSKKLKIESKMHGLNQDDISFA